VGGLETEGQHEGKGATVGKEAEAHWGQHSKRDGGGGGTGAEKKNASVGRVWFAAVAGNKVQNTNAGNNCCGAKKRESSNAVKSAIPLDAHARRWE